MAVHEATVFHHLDREWERLLASGQLARALVRWRTREKRLAEFERVRDLLALLEDRDGTPSRQSEVLLALLRLAPTDELAARFVLQRFIPPLKSIAGWKQPLPQVDWAPTVVAAAWEVIVTYPVARRPRCVAANIVWDVRKRMYAALADLRRWRHELSAGEPEDTRVEPDVAERFEAVDVVRWVTARSHVPADVARLIVLTRDVGFPLEELADRWGEPSARLRQRRWRCEQRMREVLAAAC